MNLLGVMSTQNSHTHQYFSATEVDRQKEFKEELPRIHLAIRQQSPSRLNSHRHSHQPVQQPAIRARIPPFRSRLSVKNPSHFM
jgi:hypothetical protein